MPFRLRRQPRRLLLAALVGLGLLGQPSGLSGQGCPDRAVGPGSLHAAISIEQSGGMLAVNALCRADEEAALRFEFVAEKIGGGGSSRSTQRGDRGIRAGETAVLGSLRLGPADGTVWRFVLRLWQEGALVGECEEIYPSGP